MPKPVASLKEKLAKLELQASKLLEAREREINSIFKACSSLTIDDHLLTGFLLFVNNPSNKDHPIFKEFTNLAKVRGLPSKPRKTRAADKTTQERTK